MFSWAFSLQFNYILPVISWVYGYLYTHHFYKIV